MCRFLCNKEETQSHIFENCESIKSRISYPMNVNLEDIYGSIDDQIRTIKSLTVIDHIKRSMIQKRPTWGSKCQDPCGYINVFTIVDFNKNSQKLKSEFCLVFNRYG